MDAAGGRARNAVIGRRNTAGRPGDHGRVRPRAAIRHSRSCGGRIARGEMSESVWSNSVELAAVQQIFDTYLTAETRL
jgi:hypothetical protein